MNDYCYRTCQECGKKWNVSAKNKDEKVMSALYADKREIRKRYLNQSADT